LDLDVFLFLVTPVFTPPGIARSSNLGGILNGFILQTASSSFRRMLTAAFGTENRASVAAVIS